MDLIYINNTSLFKSPHKLRTNWVQVFQSNNEFNFFKSEQIKFPMNQLIQLTSRTEWFIHVSDWFIHSGSTHWLNDLVGHSFKVNSSLEGKNISEQFKLWFVPYRRHQKTWNMVQKLYK